MSFSLNFGESLLYPSISKTAFFWRIQKKTSKTCQTISKIEFNALLSPTSNGEDRKYLPCFHQKLFKIYSYVVFEMNISEFWIVVMAGAELPPEFFPGSATINRFTFSTLLTNSVRWIFLNNLHFCTSSVKKTNKSN